VLKQTESTGLPEEHQGLEILRVLKKFLESSTDEVEREEIRKIVEKAGSLSYLFPKS
jgi:hypothetical protein